jgi:low temperature requirement protein LtrA
MVINLSWVELFYDLVFAATLASFAYQIAFGWPGGKWLNFVEMVKKEKMM